MLRAPSRDLRRRPLSTAITRRVPKSLGPHDTRLVYDEVRPLGQAGLVLNTILFDNLTLEVREQRELDAPLLGSRPVCPGRVHADTHDPGALLLRALDLLLQLTHLVPTYVRPAPGIERRSNRPLGPRVFESDLVLPRITPQPEIWGPISNLCINATSLSSSAVLGILPLLCALQSTSRRALQSRRVESLSDVTLKDVM